MVGWRIPDPPHYADDLPIILRSLVKLDLTYTASLYFGVGPIKQITHNREGVFNAKDKTQMREEAENRRKQFEDALNGAASKFYPSGRLASYRERLRLFDAAFEKWKENNSISSYPFYSEDLAAARDKCVRFGNDIKAIPLWDRNWETVLSGTDFEIYVPVHEIYETDILSCRKQFTQIEGTKEERFIIACRANATHMPEFNSEDTDKPLMTWNYLIFRYTYTMNTPNWSATKLRDPPRFPEGFRSLCNNNFEQFGRFFLVFHEGSELKLMDITSGPVGSAEISEAELVQPRPCVCTTGGSADGCFVKTKFLDTLNSRQVLMIFRFDSARQL